MTNAPTWPYNASGGQQEIPVDYPDEIIASTSGLEKLPGGGIIAIENTREVRIGELLARLSADVAGLGKAGQLVPRKSGEAAALATSGAQFIMMKDPHPFVVGDTLTFGGTADNEVITAINYETGRVDLATTLSANVAANERVYVNANGLGTAVGVAAERVTPVAETIGIAAGRVSLYIGGLFYANKIKGGLAGGGLDTAAIASLGAVVQASPVGSLARIRVGV